MKRKELIKVNIINIVLLALVVLFKVVTGVLFDESAISKLAATKEKIEQLNACNNFCIALFVVLFLAWAGYAFYSNWSIIKEDEEDEKQKFSRLKNRISKAGNLKFFVEERKRFEKMWDGIQSREKYFLSDERDERVRELYILTRNQMYRYVTDAADYLESYDYYSGKDSGYLKGVCDESQKLLDKFNKMVELSVSVDDEVLSYDTQEIDDMIEALEYMKNSGKNKLGI